MGFDFDQIVERRGSNSAKWRYYPEDVLPMWVADMDFLSPEPIRQALIERAEHGMYGYELPPAELTEVICARLKRLYGWNVTAEQVVYLPSLVTGINAVCRAVGEPGDGVVMSEPIYPPFLMSPPLHQRKIQTGMMSVASNARILRYSLNFDTLEEATTPETRLLLFCNPHNPVGRAYQRDELEEVAEYATRHDLVVCSDEIHCDLLLGETQHTPFATLSPEVAERTITLMAPSKTFNLPGLGCGCAIVPNDELRKQLEQAMMGIVPHVNAMGFAGALAAYRDCDDWLAALRAYLTANRDLLVQFVTSELPQVQTTIPEATYLGWLDCRAAGIDGDPYQFFLKEAKVALSNGAMFGPNGEGFVRINFGCPRALLLEGLGRLKSALEAVNA